MSAVDMPGRMSHGFWAEIQSRRGDYLCLALRDARKWLAPAHVRVGSLPSDQFWLQQFGTEVSKPVSPDCAHSFLITFQLVRYTRWDDARVADLIEEVRQLQDFDVVTGVSRLASKLRCANTRGTRQTSAASKLANFLKPSSSVFIWDTLATRSARARDYLRHDGKERLRTGPYVDAVGDHDYAAYWRACKAALDDVCRSTEFKAAAQKLETNSRHCVGMIGNAAKVPDDFFDRRLLDKLMFWEGWALKRGRHPEQLVSA